jgi:16S rRNA (adenine1518-N6/adenine1519-N6)-dimethyltransferase
MSPKKRLGQHFLAAQYYAERIAAAVPADADDPVLEIGPGRGALSLYLRKRFPRFHMVEIDEEVVPDLTRNLGPGEWTLHRENVMAFDFKRAGAPLHVVGNLPYNIGARIIRKTLMCGTDVRSCTFMLQKEVAQRIVAVPDTRANGFLTIFCQFFSTPRILFFVPAGAFVPRPDVESAVVQFTVRQDLDSRLPAESREDFFSFVEKGFGMRRKRLANALGRGGDRGRVERLLDAMHLDRGVRAEDLGVDEWLKLYKEDRSCA